MCPKSGKYWSEILQLFEGFIHFRLTILSPIFSWPVPSAALSKAYVCGRSPAEIVSSNPAEGMDVCCDYCVIRELSLLRADHSSRGVLPTVMRRSRNLKNVEVIARVRPQPHRKKKSFVVET